MATARILVVDDEPEIGKLIRNMLEPAGYEAIVAESGREALHKAGRRRPDVAIVDLNVPRMDGFQTVRDLREMYPQLPCLTITDSVDVFATQQSVLPGDFVWINKPIKSPDLLAAVEAALGSRRLEPRLAQPDDAPEIPIMFHGMVGRSPPMLAVFQRIAVVGPTATSVLIAGESGTGKELVASALHRLSGRPGPFVAVNVGAVPDTLFEAALFGHEKGAFTGAESQKRGLMEGARGGTLFLDEIATLPPNLEAKLLRALDEREILRLGGTTPLPIDVRVIAATNRDLVVAMAEGAFRDDLYYRLAEVTIHLPPLRDRRGDVALLIDHFLPRVAAELGMCGEITAPARQVLEAYRWPGNVRQVRAVLKEALLSAIAAPIQVHDLPTTVRNGDSPLRLVEKPLPPGVTLDQALAAFERACIVQALEEAGGRKELAARRLGKDPKTLWRKLRGDRA